jgi:hypothetical protein
MRAIAAEVGCSVGSVRGAIGRGPVGEAWGGDGGAAQEQSCRFCVGVCLLGCGAVMLAGAHGGQGAGLVDPGLGRVCCEILQGCPRLRRPGSLGARLNVYKIYRTDFSQRVNGVRFVCVGTVGRTLEVLLFRSLRRCVCELSST